MGARRTRRLGDLQRHLGLALGGEAGARLAARLAMSTSPDTLLRMARRGDPAPAPRPPVRVLAVDDWAWRRGHRYGTVLVDLERNRVVDLLPDRQAEDVGSLAEAASRHRGRRPGSCRRLRRRWRQGAPDAVQVTDRWLRPALRAGRIGLTHAQFAEATCGTLRLALLKVGALVRRSVRRISVAMASAYPHQAEFALAHARLTAAPA